jgi:hypothetical protein
MPTAVSINRPWGQRKPPPGTFANPKAAADLGLVAALLFNENGSLSANDITGRSNGTLNAGVSWAAGQFGPSLKFDGTTGFVDAGNDASARMTLTLSLSAWIFISGALITDEPIIAHGGSAGNGYNMYVPNSSGYYLEFADTNIANGGQSTATTPLTAGVWNHVAVTLDGQNLRYYINGRLRSSVAWTRIYSYGTRDLRIGSSEDDAGVLFSGLIDLPMVFNRALTAEQVAQLCADPFWWVQPRRVWASVPAVPTNLATPYQIRKPWGRTKPPFWTQPNVTAVSDLGLLFLCLFNENANRLVDIMQDYLAFPNANVSSLSWGQPSQSVDNAPIDGAALLFPGVTDSVSWTSAPKKAYQPTTSGSIAVWIFPLQTAGNQNVFGYGGFNAGTNGVTININSGIQTMFAAAATNQLTTLILINANQWYHYAVTWNGATINEYINGVIVQTTTQTIAVTSGVNNVAVAGDPGNTFNNLYKGFVSMAMISRNVWPAPVVERLYRDPFYFMQPRVAWSMEQPASVVVPYDPSLFPFPPDYSLPYSKKYSVAY